MTGAVECVLRAKSKILITSTRDFFKKRAQKYNVENPYSVTMYQDNNADLVHKRNQYETEKLNS